jgi:hypothetical protein
MDLSVGLKTPVGNKEHRQNGFSGETSICLGDVGGWDE